jgi:PAS domain S-box-containing protein
MDPRTLRIRALNDELRQNMAAGVAVMTPGVAALGREAVDRIVKTVAVFDDFCHANDPHEEHDFEHIVQTILRTGEAITGIEVSGQRPDGGNAERVWLTYWHPLKNTAGNILGINVVAEEITERKRAEAALAESEARFRELADNMSQFAWTTDASGRRTWFNKRWHDYTGTTLEDVRGTKWQKLVHPDHVERVNNRIRESHESGKPWEDTYPLQGRGGDFRWFLTRAVPIRNENGDVVRWFGTNTDVTRQVEAENALRSLNESLGA